MKLIKISLIAIAGLFSTNALAQDYVMSCDEIVTKLDREATAEAKARFADLRGSCMGVVEKNGELYMHTKLVVRRVRGNNVTFYLPATDRTFTTSPDPASRANIGGRNVRARDLVPGQELNLYVSVDEFTQPVIREVAWETETEEIVAAPVSAVAALPTTG